MNSSLASVTTELCSRWFGEPMLATIPAFNSTSAPPWNKAYEAGSHRDRIDYHAPCEPPLPADDQSWADELIRASGG